MALVELSGFLGANLKLNKRLLPPSVGVLSVNQKPSEEGDFRPWRSPLAIATPPIGAARKTLYRMGRDTPDPAAYWLSWTTLVHVIRAFDAEDPTERTYFTGSGSPKWTDTTMAFSGTPYPNATRELAVPQPTVPPTVMLDVDGESGDARQLYYVYTWVNDLGWESAPSPPFLAPAAKPGATLNLAVGEAPPAGNYGITIVRWYRTQVVAGTTDAEYLFLRQYALGSVGMKDDARKLGEVLASETWLPLPANASWLTYCWNQFASALVDKSVRLCVPNYVYAWPIEHEYILPAKPIAQAAFAQRLLVFTEAGAELFTGSDPGAMDQKPMTLALIASQRSLVVGESWCIWAAKDGLWYYGVDGLRCLTGNSMSTAQWAALQPTTIAGYLCKLGERTLYVGFYNDGALKGFVVDPANPDGIYFLSQGYAAGFWDPLLSALFVLDGSTVKQWDAGADFMTATFKSRVVRQVSHVEGEWVELVADGGPCLVKVITDQTTPFNRAVGTGEHRLPDGTGGREWQLEVQTATSVQGVVVE
ncbi:MAG TPA: hypothetical protein VGF12_06995 [Roseateles sp.]|uniref:hypothetical protein n=1 Tax=Roseateles sp. TaxID=1971397 RepID=UPI002ED9C3F1